jgi:signal transduction histidine kinase
MSYQIRTPLNTVVGFAELFQMEHNKEDEAVFINEIKENSAYLLKLINDILFLSRLDARMIEFKTQPTDFAAFFEPHCQTAFAKYEHEGVKYTADNPYHKLVIDIDMQNLGIVIDRIMENAAKYTEKGSVRARYDYIGEQLVIACQDTGCGIPEEGLKQIFERFASNDSQSTGLSLSICYELVKQMDGRITFKSEVGRGTIVWITIPCKVIELERK